MTGIKDREDPTGSEPDEGPDPDSSPVSEQRGLSPGLFNSLALMLIGVSVGVFWREVFQLTIRAIEAFR